MQTGGYKLIQAAGLMIYRNKLRMIYKAYALMIYNFFEIDDIQGLRLDLSLKARYNKLIDNQEFVEKIATASCLSALTVCDIISSQLLEVVILWKRKI